MKRGFILGKFMPPHNGHLLLCQTAAALVDELTILVCWLPDDPIAGQQRLAWMSEMFPNCRVVGHDKIVPQAPEESQDFWMIWRDIVLASCPDGLDYVFASESYGRQLADVVGAHFWPVDLGRQLVPISGTEVRNDPLRNWRHIPAPVRPAFARKICLHGPESTGKSQLAKQLSDHFDTLFVPEYGRTYCEEFGTDLVVEDLLKIGKTHHAMTLAATRQCNGTLILDTDPLMTAVWSDMMLGSVAGYHRDPWFAEFSDYADLYLLLDIDLPWHNDGTRIYGSAKERQHFFDLCKAELEVRGVKWALVQGEGEARFQSALRHIEAAAE
jgi:HTH-type transcriptional regulator, transcriptional repressor of NAD biosynthesis genes